MKIDRMNKVNWGKVRAFFDLVTNEGFTIKGFKLIEGINGLFVSMPSQKGNDDEYYDTIWVDSKQLRDELNTLAITQYQSSENNMPMDAAISEDSNNTTTDRLPEEQTTGGNIKEEATPAEASATTGPTFSDDDIPF